MAADEYRKKAAEFGAKARAEKTPSLKAEFEALALSYLRLAEQAERNSQVDIVYEAAPARPVVQQQQQQSPPQKTKK